MIHVAAILSHAHTHAVSELMDFLTEFFSLFTAPTCFQLKLHNSAALRPLCFDLLSAPYFSYLTGNSTKLINNLFIILDHIPFISH